MRNIFVGLCHSIEFTKIADFKNIKSKFISETVKNEITKQMFDPDYDKGNNFKITFRYS